MAIFSQENDLVISSTYGEKIVKRIVFNYHHRIMADDRELQSYRRCSVWPPTFRDGFW